MAYSIKVKSVGEGYSQADNKSFIDVEVEVYRDGEFASIKKFGYPLETTKEEIEADLKKLTETLESDEGNAIKDAALTESLKNVESAKELIDKEIL